MEQQRSVRLPSAATGLDLSPGRPAQPDLYAAFMQAPSAMCILQGPGHIYTFSNPEYDALVEGRPVLGRTVSEALPELEAQGFVECLDQVYATGEPFFGKEVPVDLQAPEGGIRHMFVDFSYTPVFDADGRVDSILAIAVDVTDKVRVRQALEARRAESEGHHRRIVASLAEGLIVRDREGNILELNEAAQRLTRMSVAEIDSKATFDPSRGALDGEGRPIRAEDHPTSVALRTGKSIENMEFGLVQSDGSVVWLNLNVRLLWRDGESEPYAAVSTFTDQTARKEAELALRKQQELTDRIIAHAPAAIAYIDRDGYFQRANDAYLAMTGLTAEQVIGRHAHAIFGPEFDTQLGEIWRQIYATGEAHHGTNFPFSYTRNGETHLSYWDFTHAPVFGPDGQAMGILNLSVEVSDRVRAARLQQAHIEQLQENDKLKDQFLGILSHELRTPLNAIQGFGSILEDELAGPLNDKQRQYLGTIMDGSDRMLALVNNLLDMSRMQAGAFSVAPVTGALAPAVADALAPLQLDADSKGIELKNEVPDDLPAIAIDHPRIVQVVTNLVTNALKVVPTGGRVTVRATHDRDALRCEVIDTGCGIASEHLGKLFKSFSQVDMTDTRHVGGVGLGLTICKGLVEAHGGQIGVETAPGQGANFWFTLPLARS